MFARTIAGIVLFLVLACVPARLAWADPAAPPPTATPTATPIATPTPVAAGDTPTTAPAANPSKAEVVALLRGHGTPQEWSACIQAVREMGPRAYPAMAEALEETDDVQLVKTILLVTSGTNGDKTAAVRGLEKYLARPHGMGDMERSARAEAVHALGEFGRYEHGDALARLRDALLGLAEDDDEAVRIAAFEELPKVCHYAEAGLVQALYAKRLKLLNEPAEIASDLTLKAAEKAVVQVEMYGQPTSDTLVASAVAAYAKRLQMLRTPEEIATDPELRHLELLIRLTLGDDATSVSAALRRNSALPTTATATHP